jgi:DNA-directed RNA polymerase subunit RPC12/RpoP
VARVPITVMGYKCEKCAAEWIPEDVRVEPEFCPNCKSKTWNKPTGPMLSYEDFCRKIVSVLRDQSPLTWTEIRTAAGLPQRFPNNAWVHRMESDIGLIRTKDSHGIINWQLRELDRHATAA